VSFDKATVMAIAEIDVTNGCEAPLYVDVILGFSAAPPSRLRRCDGHQYGWSVTPGPTAHLDPARYVDSRVIVTGSSIGRLKSTDVSHK
jgi:hypothetical protein